MERYLEGVRSALHGAGLPYGYTIAIWSSGAALMNSHGTPHVGWIMLFAAGAMGAYGALRVGTSRVSADTDRQLAASPQLLRAGAIHVLAIGSAIGSAALAALLATPAAWPIGSFSATLVYFLITSAELALFEPDED